MTRARGATVLLLLSSCLTQDVLPLDADAGAVCDHSTCSGCCSDGVCVTGYADEACGLLGRRCDACSTQQVCSSTRRCEDLPGDGGLLIPWAPNDIVPTDRRVDGGLPPGPAPQRCYRFGIVWACT